MQEAILKNFDEQLQDLRKRFKVCQCVDGEESWVSLLEADTIHDAFDQIDVLKRLDACNANQKYTYLVWDSVDDQIIRHRPSERAKNKLKCIKGGLDAKA